MILFKLLIFKMWRFDVLHFIVIYALIGICNSGIAKTVIPPSNTTVPTTFPLTTNVTTTDVIDVKITILPSPSFYVKYRARVTLACVIERNDLSMDIKAIWWYRNSEIFIKRDQCTRPNVQQQSGFADNCVVFGDGEVWLLTVTVEWMTDDMDYDTWSCKVWATGDQTYFMSDVTRIFIDDMSSQCDAASNSVYTQEGMDVNIVFEVSSTTDQNLFFPTTSEAFIIYILVVENLEDYLAVVFCFNTVCQTGWSKQKVEIIAATPDEVELSLLNVNMNDAGQLILTSFHSDTIQQCLTVYVTGKPLIPSLYTWRDVGHTIFTCIGTATTKPPAPFSIFHYYWKVNEEHLLEGNYNNNEARYVFADSINKLVINNVTEDDVNTFVSCQVNERLDYGQTSEWSSKQQAFKADDNILEEITTVSSEYQSVPEVNKTAMITGVTVTGGVVLILTVVGHALIVKWRRKKNKDGGVLTPYASTILHMNNTPQRTPSGNYTLPNEAAICSNRIMDNVHGNSGYINPCSSTKQQRQVYDINTTLTAADDYDVILTESRKHYNDVLQNETS